MKKLLCLVLIITLVQNSVCADINKSLKKLKNQLNELKEGLAGKVIEKKERKPATTALSEQEMKRILETKSTWLGYTLSTELKNLLEEIFENYKEMQKDAQGPFLDAVEAFKADNRTKIKLEDFENIEDAFKDVAETEEVILGLLVKLRDLAQTIKEITKQDKQAIGDFLKGFDTHLKQFDVYLRSIALTREFQNKIVTDAQNTPPSVIFDAKIIKKDNDLAKNFREIEKEIKQAWGIK